MDLVLPPLEGTVQLDEYEQRAISRCTDQVSAMVERLQEARQEGSGEVPQRDVVKDYRQVLDKLHQERAKLPQPPALFVLKTGRLGRYPCVVVVVVVSLECRWAGSLSLCSGRCRGES